MSDWTDDTVTELLRSVGVSDPAQAIAAYRAPEAGEHVAEETSEPEAAARVEPAATDGAEGAAEDSTTASDGGAAEPAPSVPDPEPAPTSTPEELQAARETLEAAGYHVDP